nr:ty1-copia retrotransposon protein [Ipomoea batatas]GMD07321.1 ty1-copia retrotransposon protein [Ipomoea batatas]GME19545.1 ty1-copia retrotransposon protein [Ipomoea batatas]
MEFQDTQFFLGMDLNKRNADSHSPFRMCLVIDMFHFTMFELATELAMCCGFASSDTLGVRERGFAALRSLMGSICRKREEMATSKLIPDLSKLEPLDITNFRRWSQRILIFFRSFGKLLDLAKRTLSLQQASAREAELS